MGELIPQEVLDRARRRIKRQIVAQLIWAMGEEDATFESLAVTLGASVRSIRSWFTRMTNGEGPDLNEVSDMAIALGDEIKFELHKRPELRPIWPGDLGLSRDGTLAEEPTS